MNPINPWLIVAALAGAIAIGAGGYAKGHSDAATAAEASAAKLAADNERKARETEHMWQGRVDALQAQLEKDKRDADAREALLRADVDAARRSLRISARCPVAGTETPGTAGGGDGGPVELSTEARQAYFDLRAAIISDDRALRACQAYVRSLDP